MWRVESWTAVNAVLYIYIGSPFIPYKSPDPLALIHSADVPRSLGPQLLPDHREAGGGCAGVPNGGGAHLQPCLCATGQMCRVLWGREPGVPSYPNHKCYHAGRMDEGFKVSPM